MSRSTRSLPHVSPASRELVGRQVDKENVREAFEFLFWLETESDVNKLCVLRLQYQEQDNIAVSILRQFGLQTHENCERSVNIGRNHVVGFVFVLHT